MNNPSATPAGERECNDEWHDFAKWPKRSDKCPSCGGAVFTADRDIFGTPAAERDANHRGASDLLCKGADLDGLIALLDPEILDEMAEAVERGERDLDAHTSEPLAIPLFLSGLAAHVRALSEGGGDGE